MIKRKLDSLIKDEKELVEKTTEKVEELMRIYPHFNDDSEKLKSMEIETVYQKMKVYINIHIYKN